MDLIHVNLINNSAMSTGNQVGGGAIYSYGVGSTRLAGCTLSNNQASNGGHIYVNMGNLEIYNSVLMKGFASGTGGVFHNGGW